MSMLVSTLAMDISASQSFPRSFRDVSTEPSTPVPVRDDEDRIAVLIPLNRAARLAMDATARLKSEYHQHFIGETIFYDNVTKCFNLSLSHLPEFPNLGWRIGRGCASFGNRGVDFLLCKEDEEDEDNSEDRVTNIHARFNWVKGAGGFFIIADNNERRKVILDGEIVRADQRPIQFENTIIIGECLFTLRYESRNREENDNFDIKLGQFFDKFHQDNNPLILPTPSERFSQFKEWIFHYPIAKGVFGTVYMVTNSRTGEPAAAKRIFRSGRNSRNVDREISMVRRISKLVHKRLSNASEIHQLRTQTKAEIARIRTCLDENWMPTSESITDEYIIISPLSNTTFGSLHDSNVSTEGKAIFFVQLLEAVAFLHENGFCHRDIKPENILVRSYEPPEAMLTDFGCASDKETIMYDWPGTVPYLAPEQVEGKTHGRAVDYWSCGLVGMELSLGGRIKSRLMPGPDLMAVHEHLRKENSSLAKCSRAMLEEDPETRMTAAQGLDFFSSLKETDLSLSSPIMAYQPSFLGETNPRLLQKLKPKSRLASDFATHREIQEPYNAPSASTRSKARKWANPPSLNAEINSSERPKKQLKKGNWLGKMAPNG